MTYIYIDESGDLGFHNRSSSYFVVTCVKINDEKTHLSFKRIPKKVRERLLDKKEKLTICLDRCMSLSQRQNFEMYVQTVFFSLFQQLPQLSITHESSSNNECLQVTDFICGAFGYKHNTTQLQNDFACYTSIIKERIRIEKTDLFKEKANHTYLS